MARAEMIKPSSPTPPHLRNHQLSLLDQIAPPIYFHFILYFSPSDRLTHISDGISQALKRSLSDALAVYYPLAGRLREDHTVDCNDAGAEYGEAAFDGVRILDVIESSQPEELKQYVPAAPAAGGDVPLAVQVNFFGCSGMAIGICVSHKLADAKTGIEFISTWAAACRGDVETVAAAQPSFGMASRFPPLEFSGFIPGPDENVVTKRFTFDAEKIEKLKAAVAAAPLLEKPSRVEAVSAFIWRRFIEVAKTKDEMSGESVDRGFMAVHAVDLRGRASPPVAPSSFGNGTAGVMAVASAEEGERSYHGLAVKLREAFRAADADFVRKYEDGSVFSKSDVGDKEKDATPFKEVQLCVFSSWWRFPAYDADYGWGKPAWVSNVAVPVKNMIVFFGTKSGDGIEAWVTMDKDEIELIDLGFE